MSSEPRRDGEGGVSSEEFLAACGRFATGVAIASVVDASGAAFGLTVSSFTSVSLEPPLILISIGHAAARIEAFRHASHFGISILREQDRSLSERFAARGQDHFEGAGWRRGETGVPVIDCALAAIECKVHERFTAGDHDLLIGCVVRARVEEGVPLVRYASRYRRLAAD